MRIALVDYSRALTLRALLPKIYMRLASLVPAHLAGWRMAGEVGRSSAGRAGPPETDGGTHDDRQTMGHHGK